MSECHLSTTLATLIFVADLDQRCYEVLVPAVKAIFEPFTTGSQAALIPAMTQA